MPTTQTMTFAAVLGLTACCHQTPRGAMAQKPVATVAPTSVFKSNLKSNPAPIGFSNPKVKVAAPVIVNFVVEDGFLLVHFSVTSKKIHAKRELARNEYPYDFDVVEIFVKNASSPNPTYYEFEVSPYNQGLQVNVAEPRQEYLFGVKGGYEHSAKTTATGWEADMKIPLASIGWKGQEPLQLVGNAYAALGEDKKRVYWSLFELPSGKPDFHIPSAFRPLF